VCVCACTCTRDDGPRGIYHDWLAILYDFKMMLEPAVAPVTLHTLNAARVIAEYVVVHYHLSFIFHGANGLLSQRTMADSLMSFFFVLSGFVAMYSNTHVDFTIHENVKTYITRRLRKTYPLYIIMYLVDLPGAIITENQGGCVLFWISLASQPFLLHSWLGSHHIAISNGVGWYMCTLYWLWIAFPFLRLQQILSTYPWLKICGLYCVSVCMWIALYQYNILYTRAVPMFRLLEFMMGAAIVFTLKQRVHWGAVTSGLLCFLVYCIFDFQYPEYWENESLQGNCTLWIKRHNQAITPTIVLSKFSIIWVMLIHWLAAAELSSQGNWVICVLQYDVFKHLSKFSLQLYLSHSTVSYCLRTLFHAIGGLALWDIDVMIIACYTIAYLLYVWVQPICDRLFIKEPI